MNQTIKALLMKVKLFLLAIFGANKQKGKSYASLKFQPDVKGINLYLTEAEIMCRSHGGDVMTLSEEELVSVTELLRVWHHKPYMGNIWLKSKSSNTCLMILVSVPTNYCSLWIEFSHFDMCVFTVICFKVVC